MTIILIIVGYIVLGAITAGFLWRTKIGEGGLTFIFVLWPLFWVGGILQAGGLLFFILIKPFFYIGELVKDSFEKIYWRI
jgi:hypothetical protein